MQPTMKSGETTIIITLQNNRHCENTQAHKRQVSISFLFDENKRKVSNHGTKLLMTRQLSSLNGTYRASLEEKENASRLERTAKPSACGEHKTSSPPPEPCSPPKPNQCKEDKNLQVIGPPVLRNALKWRSKWQSPPPTHNNSETSSISNLNSLDSSLTTTISRSSGRPKTYLLGLKCGDLPISDSVKNIFRVFAKPEKYSISNPKTITTEVSLLWVLIFTSLRTAQPGISPKTEKFSEDGGNDRLRYGLSSMQGWRAAMEDAHATYPDLDASTSFFGVYDGHGGKVVAKFCAKFLHQQVLKNQAYAAGDIGTSVQKAFFRMDEMMRGQRGWRELAVLGDKINRFTGMIEGLIWSPRSSDSNEQADDWAFEEGPHSDFSGPTSGSTACVAIVRNKQLVVANAGDSRCVISRKGQAYNLSRDHKPDLEVEKERILKAGGFIHAGRVNGSLNLARAIGDMEFKQNKFLPAEKQIVTANPDINIVELCDDDEFLVLACDGVWDCMSSQQLVDFIHEQLHSENKLSAVCERVLDRCLAPSTAGGEGCDNMTMILVQFKKPMQPTADEQQSSPSTESKPAGDSESS
ncbi:putative protein phosphatase 2C 60 [Morus notabilis]|uniref:protein-serine/threonine phosphatase n=1 Tax=Morus notabilis TaxID=981085 RepID=W9RZH9_9ROSA|nr:putative protein phosphatase 2C 60 [Morus notabilis]